ncbi:MAG: Tm-1-like ATP-binding domain-containing protein [Proteobacteria bacterium]|nr:Tm-1-like ATP-binding domain-containing protein [Pseudomonadota bacterium]
MKRIIILGTLDTKAQQIAYLKEKIEARGQKAVILDLSMGNEPPFKADIPPSEILACSGPNSGSDVPAFLKEKGIAELKKVMAIGAGNKVMELLSKGEIDGIVALGGLSMAMLAASIMQRLPFGIPKVIGTTAAMVAYVKDLFGASDITLMQLIVEVGSINDLAWHAIEQVAGAISGMVDIGKNYTSLKLPPNSVAITELNFTPKCARWVEELLEKKGYNVFSFHAQGTSDRVMDNFIANGFFDGVIDIVPAGLVEEYYGGTRAAGMQRLDAPIERGIPLVLTPCCLNLTGCGPTRKNFEKYISRPTFKLDELRSYVRFNPEELKVAAGLYAEKLNKAKGPIKFLFPMKGWSNIDKAGTILYNPQDDLIFLNELKALLKAKIDIEEIDCNLEDEEFAVRLVDSLDSMLTSIKK